MSLPTTSNYFEILSHPVRYSILKALDINIRNFGEILKEISLENDIGSSKLNFHLKKLVDLEIIEKNDKLYSISDIGLKLLSLIHNFEILEQHNEFEEYNNNSTLVKSDIKQKEEKESYSLENLLPEDNNQLLPLINRPSGLPLIFSMFEYFEGKNYDFMEEHYYLKLPEPITELIPPMVWIRNFSNNLESLLQNETSKDWLIDRLLKLGYGTRGLQDFGLMDASISVPPLQSLIDSILKLLSERGKVGLFAKTGMGKSRIALYLASYWIRTHETSILYLQNPNLLDDDDLKGLQRILLENIPKDRKSPGWLIIVEDAHLSDKAQSECLYKLISGASNKTYSILVSFTDIPLINNLNNSIDQTDEFIKNLKKELIPDEYSNLLDLDKHWLKLKPFFKEWLKWISADILIDYLPPLNFKENEKIYQSPWAFVVSLGFLKNSLKDLKNSILSNNFPLILYYSIAQIYIMRGERSLSLSILIKLLSNHFNYELEKVFGEDWIDKINLILNDWTLPAKRLLPPFKYTQNKKSLSRETMINFYHIQWANEACNYLDEINKNEINDYNQFFEKLFPFLKEIWSYLKFNGTFTNWLRLYVGFDINNQGEIRLTNLRLNSDSLKILSSFKMPESRLKTLNQDQLVNWLFVKSIIYE